MTNTNFSKPCALITGATGYIGSKLVEKVIEEGWDVHVIVRANSNLDVLNAVITSITIHHHDGTTQGMISLLAKAKPHTVFHLASVFLSEHQPRDVESLINSNLLFSTQLAEAMVANGIKFLVNTGTSWQHHNNAEYNPVNLYAATKQAFEDILTYYIDAEQFKVTTLVLFDTYGPNDPRNKLITLLWRTAQTQELLLMSPGEQLIDIVHIDDVLNAFVLAAEALPCQEVGHVRYGVSSGKPMRLIDLVSAFQNSTGYILPIIWGGRPYRPREVMTPWVKYQTVPSWHPRISFENGVLQIMSNE